MKLLNKVPGWVLVAGFFALIAVSYLLLNHFLGFSREAHLFI